MPPKETLKPAPPPRKLVRRVEFSAAINVPGLPIAVRQLETGVLVRPYTPSGASESVPAPEMEIDGGELVIGKLRIPLTGGLIRVYELV